MKINAYILAADPAWIEASVLSYYDHVDRIVVSYDADGLGWTGAPIDVEQSLKRLRAIDRLGKLDWRPGHFARQENFSQPLTNDTHQRQTALDQAATDADWVVQLDTDEVLCDADRFSTSLERADRGGFAGLDFPARWLYRQCRAAGVFLEQCRRGWRVGAGYPGPVAVRRGSLLRVARQGPKRRYRVDFASVTTDPSYPRDTKIDEVISPSEGIAHFSWARSEEAMWAKSTASGHAHEFKWRPLIENWEFAGRHPWLASLCSQVERGNLKRHLRLTSVKLPSSITERLPPHFDFKTGSLNAAMKVTDAVAQSTSNEAFEESKFAAAANACISVKGHG